MKIKIPFTDHHDLVLTKTLFGDEMILYNGKKLSKKTSTGGVCIHKISIPGSRGDIQCELQTIEVDEGDFDLKIRLLHSGRVIYENLHSQLEDFESGKSKEQLLGNSLVRGGVFFLFLVIISSILTLREFIRLEKQGGEVYANSLTIGIYEMWGVAGLYATTALLLILPISLIVSGLSKR